MKLPKVEEPTASVIVAGADFEKVEAGWRWVNDTDILDWWHGAALDRIHYLERDLPEMERNS